MFDHPEIINTSAVAEAYPQDFSNEDLTKKKQI